MRPKNSLRVISQFQSRTRKSFFFDNIFAWVNVNMGFTKTIFALSLIWTQFQKIPAAREHTHYLILSAVNCNIIHNLMAPFINHSCQPKPVFCYSLIQNTPYSDHSVRGTSHDHVVTVPLVDYSLCANLPRWRHW